jgi:hypothetical protein
MTSLLLHLVAVVAEVVVGKTATVNAVSVEVTAVNVEVIAAVLVDVMEAMLPH